jgi:hypothetical protein
MICAMTGQKSRDPARTQVRAQAHPRLPEPATTALNTDALELPDTTCTTPFLGLLLLAPCFIRHQVPVGLRGCAYSSAVTGCLAYRPMSELTCSGSV